ncbi:MAG: acyltransferase [Chitinophagaceae bacterium]|nr:acyltransferase [Oligoflexus sp.]
MQVTDSRKYINNLTGVRAWFSIWIVLFHFNAAPLVRIPLFAVFIDRGHVATDFFLILSGFVVSYIYFKKMSEIDAFDYAEFLLKRFARLYPLHLLTFLIMVLFYLGLLLVGHAPTDPNHFSKTSAVLNILMIHSWSWLPLSWNFLSWSVSAEWFAYFFVFAFVLTQWRQLSQFMRALLVITLYLLYATHIYDSYLPPRLTRMSFNFLFGTWIFHCLPSFKTVSQSFWRCLLVGIPAMVVVIIFRCEDNNLHLLISPLWGAFILALFHERGLSDLIFANVFVMRVGKISFSTYLLHGVLVKLLFYLQTSELPFITPLHRISPYVLLPIALVTTLAISNYIHHSFELPARDWTVKWGIRGLNALKVWMNSQDINIRSFFSRPALKKIIAELAVENVIPKEAV